MKCVFFLRGIYIILIDYRDLVAYHTRHIINKYYYRDRTVIRLYRLFLKWCFS